MWLCDWLCDWLCGICTMKIDHLFADVVCIFLYFQILMWATWCWCCWWWLWEIKITVYLTTLPPCPGHPLTRVVSLDSLSPVLSLTDVCVSWFPPQLVTSLEPPLGPGWHPRTHILIFTYPAQEINYLDLITLEDGTGAPNSRLGMVIIAGNHCWDW